jgi:hypothetical protein
MNNRPVEDELEEVRKEFLGQKSDTSDENETPTKNKFVEKPSPIADTAGGVISDIIEAFSVGGIIEAVGDVISNMLE